MVTERRTIITETEDAEGAPTEANNAFKVGPYENGVLTLGERTVDLHAIPQVEPGYEQIDANTAVIMYEDYNIHCRISFKNGRLQLSIGFATAPEATLTYPRDARGLGALASRLDELVRDVKHHIKIMDTRAAKQQQKEDAAKQAPPAENGLTRQEMFVSAENHFNSLMRIIKTAAPEALKSDATLAKELVIIKNLVNDLVQEMGGADAEKLYNNILDKIGLVEQNVVKEI